MSDIACQVVSILIRYLSVKSVQIHARVKRLQLFLVICLCIKLKDLDEQYFDVFYDYFEGNLLIDLKKFLVFLIELQLYFISHLLIEIQTYFVLVQRIHTIAT